MSDDSWAQTELFAGLEQARHYVLMSCQACSARRFALAFRSVAALVARVFITSGLEPTTRMRGGYLDLIMTSGYATYGRR